MFFSDGIGSMWTEDRPDGMHIVSEIDDDEMGFHSEVHYILSQDETKKLYSIVTEEEFSEICRTSGSTGMQKFLEAHDIQYRRVGAF